MSGAIPRIASFKRVEDFLGHLRVNGIAMPCDTELLSRSASPLGQPYEADGMRIGNRFAIHPMEGWDGTADGRPTELTEHRWRRFGRSGAKLIWGGEAVAVREDGRANPNQLLINERSIGDLENLRRMLVVEHRNKTGSAEGLAIGLQLTHSGRYSYRAPRILYRHPLLDKKLRLPADYELIEDAEIRAIVEDFHRAARLAQAAGFDFVDIKHCHGYLGHEFLSAHTRPGKYGGPFENRTRILGEIVSGIRANGNKIDLAVRLSAFDFVPFKPDPARSGPGKPGPGIPEAFNDYLPYAFAFGVNAANPLEYDLTEPLQFLELCAQLGVKIVNLSAGSPYYNPHIQRPAAYPPSDGCQPPEDPLVGVARQINVVRQLKARAPKDLVLVGTAYSYLQEYLPHVAQFVVRHGWTDMIGLGRMSLAYPTMLTDATEKGTLSVKSICRTFSDCTTAPRNGLVSGCYPLDKYYTSKPEFQKLKAIKKNPA